MIHPFTYKYKDKEHRFLWDNESGSLYNVDTAAFILAKNKLIPAKLTEEEKNIFTSLDPALIKEVEDELNSILDDGSLNSASCTSMTCKSYGTLKAMCLLICQDCNMRCKYCFADDGSYHTNRSMMSFEVAKASIDYLISRSGKRKQLEVDFFGGEPLLNFNVVKQTVAYAREMEKLHNKEFHFTLTTNCLALNDSAIDYINKEMDNVVLSIDGRESVHNAVRKVAGGRDSHDIVLRNALKFKEKRGNKSYYVRGTFTAQNLDFSNDVLYLNDMGFDQISMEPVVTEIEDLKIKPEHLPIIEKEYEKLAYEYIKRRKDPKKWFNFFHFYVDLGHGPCIYKRLTGCGSGCEYVSISTNGDVYPCHQFASQNTHIMGNVLKDDFDMIESKKFSINVVTQKDKCGDCFAKYFCSGGCAANNEAYTGDMNDPYQMTCAMMKKRFELALFINAVESSSD